LRLRRPDLAAVADAQPRRGEESAHEVTSSSSSSSSRCVLSHTGSRTTASAW
jgi:hypothetical protein